MASEVPQNPPAYSDAPESSYQPGYQPPQQGYPPAPPHAGYQPAGMSAYPPSGPQPMPPQGGYYPQASGYAPAPSAFQHGGVQQQSTNNVVVVSQPTTPTIAVTVIPRTNDYMSLTIVMMVLCFIHGCLPAFICLIPALVFASMASERNDAGNIDEARHYGRYALWCNLGTFAYYAVSIVGTIIAAVVVVASPHSNNDCYDC